MSIIKMLKFRVGNRKAYWKLEGKVKEIDQQGMNLV